MRQEKWDKLHKELDDALDSEFGLDEPCTFCEGEGKLVAPTTISGFKNCDCRVTFYKEETLEEAAARYTCGWGENDDEKAFIAGAKWQQEQMEKLKDFEVWKEWKNTGIIKSE